LLFAYFRHEVKLIYSQAKKIKMGFLSF